MAHYISCMGIAPLMGRSAELAIANTQEFCRQLERAYKIKPEVKRVIDWDDRDGWYGFRLKFGDRTCDLMMPGCSVENVQGEAIGSKRIFVNGGSWLWRFALSEAGEILLEIEGYARNESDRP